MLPALIEATGLVLKFNKKLFNNLLYKSIIIGSKDTQVIEIPIVDMLSPRPPYLPLAIPRDLSEKE